MGGRHWSYEEVSQYFQDHQCTLLTTEYLGCNAPLHFRCPCGTEVETCFRQFKFSEGRTRCRECSLRRKSEEDKDRNGGLHHFQTEEFKARRKKTSQERYGVDNPMQHRPFLDARAQTNIARYGVPGVSQVPAIRQRQHDGFVRKHGVSHFMHDPASRQKFRETMIARYGVPSLAFVSRRSSIAAQKFFEQVYAAIPEALREKCYFSPHSHEFNVWSDGRYFKYDFVQSAARKCIEYNGSRFHPRDDQDDDETGWCLFRPTLTVGEARAYEHQKLGALLNRGFQVLVIWDYEVKQDPSLSVRRCLDFLTDLTSGNWPNP